MTPQSGPMKLKELYNWHKKKFQYLRRNRMNDDDLETDFHRHAVELVEAAMRWQQDYFGTFPNDSKPLAELIPSSGEPLDFKISTPRNILDTWTKITPEPIKSVREIQLETALRKIKDYATQYPYDEGLHCVVKQTITDELLK